MLCITKGRRWSAIRERRVAAGRSLSSREQSVGELGWRNQQRRRRELRRQMSACVRRERLGLGRRPRTSHRRMTRSNANCASQTESAFPYEIFSISVHRLHCAGRYLRPITRWGRSCLCRLRRQTFADRVRRRLPCHGDAIAGWYPAFGSRFIHHSKSKRTI